MLRFYGTHLWPVTLWQTLTHSPSIRSTNFVLIAYPFLANKWPRFNGSKTIKILYFTCRLQAQQREQKVTITSCEIVTVLLICFIIRRHHLAPSDIWRHDDDDDDKYCANTFLIGNHSLHQICTSSCWSILLPLVHPFRAACNHIINTAYTGFLSCSIHHSDHDHRINWGMHTSTKKKSNQCQHHDVA